jgi:hypothetical protein
MTSIIILSCRIFLVVAVGVPAGGEIRTVLARIGGFVTGAGAWG